MNLTQSRLLYDSPVLLTDDGSLLLTGGGAAEGVWAAAGRSGAWTWPVSSPSGHWATWRGGRERQTSWSAGAVEGYQRTGINPSLFCMLSLGRRSFVPFLVNRLPIWICSIELFPLRTENTPTELINVCMHADDIVGYLIFHTSRFLTELTFYSWLILWHLLLPDKREFIDISCLI